MPLIGAPVIVGHPTVPTSSPPRSVGVHATGSPGSIDPCSAAAIMRSMGRTSEAERLQAMCGSPVHAGAGPAGVEPAVAGAVSGQTSKVLLYSGIAAGGVAVLAGAFFLLR